MKMIVNEYVMMKDIEDVIRMRKKQSVGLNMNLFLTTKINVICIC